MNRLRHWCRIPAFAALAAWSVAAQTEAPVERSDWFIFRGDRGLTGVAPAGLELPLESAWTFETEGAIVAAPVVVDGVVYVGAGDQAVYAIDLASGEKKWSFPTDDLIEAPALVLDGTVYVGSADFWFYALNAQTGELVWKQQTGDKILGGANYVKLDDGTVRVIVGSYDNQLWCFDAKSGDVAWRYETGNYVNGTPAIWDEKIVFGGCDAILHVVSAKTGKNVGTLELGSDCHVAGSVAMADGKVYLGHYGNEFLRADLATSKVDWAYRNPRHAFFSSAALGADRIVFGGRDKQLHCVARETGEPIWTVRTRRKIDASPVIAGDKVVVGSGDGRLYVVSLETGDELWKQDLGRSIYSSACVIDGRVVVGCNDGNLYCFKSAGGDR